MTGLAGIVDDLLASRLHLGTSGRHFADFGDDPGRLADDVAAAVTAWLAERLGSEEVRETVAREIHDAQWHDDGDCADPRGCGQDTATTWAADAALAAVVGALAGEGNADSAPEAAKTAPVSDRGPESGQGDHRDDEGRSGALDGGMA